jgi:hypothetical protein
MTAQALKLKIAKANPNLNGRFIAPPQLAPI